jgi:hypothetical protein
MGCTLTSEFRVDDTIFGRSQQSADLLSNVLGFSKYHLDIIFTAFSDIDANESGTVRINEVCKYFGIDQTKYMRVIFGVFENDKCECLNFLEFAATIWNFLTIADFLLGALTFELCDNKLGHMIQSEDVVSIIDGLHSNSTDSKKKVLAYDLIGKLKAARETFTLATYKQYLTTNKIALAPLEAIHKMLRANIIGESYWQRQTEARTKVSGSIQQMAIIRTKVETIRKEEIKMLYRKKRADADDLKRAASLKREQSVYKKLTDSLTDRTKKSRKKKEKKQKVAVLSSFNALNEESGAQDANKGETEVKSHKDAFDLLGQHAATSCTTASCPNTEKEGAAAEIQLSDIIDLPAADRKRRSSMLLMIKPSLLHEDVVKRKASVFHVTHRKRNKPPPKKTGTGKYKVAPQKTTFADFNNADAMVGEDAAVAVGKKGWLMKRDADGEVRLESRGSCHVCQGVGLSVVFGICVVCLCDVHTLMLLMCRHFM